MNDGRMSDTYQQLGHCQAFPLRYKRIGVESKNDESSDYRYIRSTKHCPVLR